MVFPCPVRSQGCQRPEDLAVLGFSEGVLRPQQPAHLSLSSTDFFSRLCT